MGLIRKDINDYKKRVRFELELLGLVLDMVRQKCIKSKGDGKHCYYSGTCSNPSGDAIRLLCQRGMLLIVSENRGYIEAMENTPEWTLEEALRDTEETIPI